MISSVASGEFWCNAVLEAFRESPISSSTTEATEPLKMFPKKPG